MYQRCHLIHKLFCKNLEFYLLTDLPVKVAEYLSKNVVQEVYVILQMEHNALYEKEHNVILTSLLINNKLTDHQLKHKSIESVFP